LDNFLQCKFCLHPFADFSTPILTQYLWTPPTKINAGGFSIGTSVWRSSRSAFRRLTGHYKCHYFHNFFFISIATFSHRRSARIKKLIKQKLIRTLQNLGVDTFPDPVGHFGAPVPAILDFAGGAALQASAPFAARLVFYH